MASLPNDLVSLPEAPSALPDDLVSVAGTDQTAEVTIPVAPPPDAGPRVPLYLGDGGRALSAQEESALYQRQDDPELSLADKIYASAVSAANDPVGSLADSVSKILAKSGVMSETNANKLGRDIRAGVESLGPLGMEFVGLSGQPRAVSRTTVQDSAAFAPPPPVTRSHPTNPMPLGVEGVARAEAGVSPAAPEFAGNINLSRIHSADDVKQVLKDTAAQNADFINARRGVITHEETRDMARLAGMTPERLAKRIEGQAFNAEEMFAARELLVAQATKVRNFARNAAGGSDLDKATFMEEMNRLVAIQEQVSGATAEAGRALQQFRMMAGASRAEVSKLVEASKAGGLDDIIEGVRRLDNAPIEDVAAFVGNALKPTLRDKVYELWINSLLSGPTTHSTNILSNSLVSALSIPEALVAAGVSKLTGSGIAAREAVGRLVGLAEGTKEGVRAALRSFRTEEPLFQTGKVELNKQQAIGGTAGRLIRLPGRMLTAEDAFFKSIGYRQEINSLATRQALSENLAGKPLAQRIAELRANPTDDMVTQAKAAADKQTFTNDLGEMGKAVQNVVKKTPGGRVIVPFIRTPSNIIKFAAERSPAAPLMKESREILAGKQGAVARDQLIARMSVGSSIGATAAYMATEGLITGGGPTDPKERAVLYRSGWQPYSVRVGNSYYSFSRLEPLGMLMGIAADMAELSQVMSEDDSNNVAALISGSVARNLTSKTWLRGVSEVLDAIDDPERYGKQWVQNLAGTAVPTGVAQVARARDPYLREARSMLDQIRSRIPGYREMLPFRRDMFGEPIRLGGAVGPDILSPIYFSAADNDPVIAEMLSLDVAPSKPQRKIGNVDLTPEQYEAYTVAAGQNARRILEMTMGVPGWKDLPKETRQDAVEDAFNLGRDIAREMVKQQFPDLRAAIVQQKMERAQ